MTLEQRARLIADQRPIDDLETFALRMLREAVDEALKRAGVELPLHREWTGAS